MYFSKNPRKSLIILILTFFLIIFGLFELGLRIFAPIALPVAGYKLTENGLKYGWGFDPHQLVRVINPDNGTVYQDYVNSHGWRDVEHSTIKPAKRFRILVLGDSNTFGYVVPLDKLYTRLLDNKLKDLNYDAEVISMGYSGWSTDQQLEAFKREGSKFKPDLVILQITLNDLDENMYWRDQGKFGERKPFYFKLNKFNQAIRYENKRFFGKFIDVNRAHFISRSQVLMRFEIAREKVKKLFCKKFHFGSAQVQQFYLETGVSVSERFKEEASKNKNCGISLAKLDNVIDKENLRTHRQLIHRIASWPEYNEFISKEKYQLENLDLNSEKWKLFNALLGELTKEVKKEGAQLALIFDQDQGHYEWLRYWVRIGGGAIVKERYYSWANKIEELANELKIDFIPNNKKIERAHRDPHPNESGNQVMAENLFDFIIENFKYRLKP